MRVQRDTAKPLIAARHRCELVLRNGLENGNAHPYHVDEPG